jgi:hypothetical protein
MAGRSDLRKKGTRFWLPGACRTRGTAVPVDGVGKLILTYKGGEDLKRGNRHRHQDHRGQRLWQTPGALRALSAAERHAVAA